MGKKARKGGSVGREAGANASKGDQRMLSVKKRSKIRGGEENYILALSVRTRLHAIKTVSVGTRNFRGTKKTITAIESTDLDIEKVRSEQ